MVKMKQSPKNILITSIVFFWFAQYVYIPFQTPYLTSIHVSSQFIGIIVGTYGISQMLLRLPVGVLADSQNRHKQLIVIGCLSSGLASVFRTVLNNGIGFLIGNLFSGLSSAMWISFMVLYMSFYSANQQQKATSQIIFANNLGMLLGFITSTCLYDLVGMRIICVFSIISGIISAFFALHLPKGGEMSESPKIGYLLQVCKQKQLIVFSILALVQQGVQMSTTMSFTNQIMKDLGGSTLVIGISSIIYMLSAVIFAKFASSDFSSKIGPKKWIPAIFTTTMLYCVFVPQCTQIYQLCLLQVLPGMSTGILFSYLTSEAMKYVPLEKKSTAMGFFQAIYALGMTVFPMICGSILESYSMSYAYYFLAVICIVSIIISSVFYSKNS